MIQETPTAEGDRVTVKESAAAGSLCPPRRARFPRGRSGDRRGPAPNGARDVGLAAAMNVPWLGSDAGRASPLLSTGDELVMPGERSAPNQLVGSNGLSPSAFVARSGATPVNLGIARDSRRIPHLAGRRARGADLLVTTGGASVGKHDIVPRSARRKRPRARLLEDRHAPGQAPDVRPHRRDPLARPAGQSGLQPGLRPALPAPGNRRHASGRQADRPHRPRLRCLAPTHWGQRPSPGLSARPSGSIAEGRRVATAFASARTAPCSPPWPTPIA